MRKAQGALEYLIIIAAVLAIAAIVVLFLTDTFSSSDESAQISECKSAASKCYNEQATSVGATCGYCTEACEELGEQYTALCIVGNASGIVAGLPGSCDADEDCTDEEKPHCNIGTSFCVECIDAMDCFDDGNACTIEGCSTEFTCETTSKTTCESGDGCCPEGCSEADDSECMPVCGNDKKETDEICDGDTKLCLEIDSGFLYQTETAICKDDCSGYDISVCGSINLVKKSTFDDYVSDWDDIWMTYSSNPGIRGCLVYGTEQAELIGGYASSGGFETRTCRTSINQEIDISDLTNEEKQSLIFSFDSYSSGTTTGYSTAGTIYGTCTGNYPNHFNAGSLIYYNSAGIEIGRRIFNHNTVYGLTNPNNCITNSIHTPITSTTKITKTYNINSDFSAELISKIKIEFETYSRQFLETNNKQYIDNVYLNYTKSIS